VSKVEGVGLHSQALEGLLELDVVFEDHRAALSRQGGLRNAPSLVLRAKPVVEWDLYVGEEYLAEFGGSRGLLDGANFDTWQAHVEHEYADPFVLRGSGVSARQQEAP